MLLINHVHLICLKVVIGITHMTRESNFPNNTDLDVTDTGRASGTGFCFDVTHCLYSTGPFGGVPSHCFYKLVRIREATMNRPLQASAIQAHASSISSKYVEHDFLRFKVTS
jgi:hypothetical protein